MTRPTRYVEDLLARLGRRAVAGVDEAGMGPLAGPVVAAAVVLPRSGAVPPVRDSKALAPGVRERLARAVRAVARGVGIGTVDAPDIDRLSIRRAGAEAMRRALAALGGPAPDFMVVDGYEVDGVSIPQVAFPGADGFVASVAAASILAKVERDRIMRALDERYPGYGFGVHMGYGTRRHLEALETLGPSPAHRRSFAPVALAARRGRVESR